MTRTLNAPVPDFPLPAIARPLLERLTELGISHRTITHPPLFTVAESQELRGSIAGAHAKNLFVKDKKGRLFLVSALEDAALDLKRLHEVIGASGRVTFASPEQMRAHIGVEPGSVTPFGAMNDRAGEVTIVLQRALAACSLVNFHPLDNRATTTLSNQDLIRFLVAVNHPPVIVDLPLRAEVQGATTQT